MSGTTTPTDSMLGSLGSNPGVNRLLDNVQAEVPGVTLPLIEMQAWNAIEEFYIQSTFRRERIFWTMGPGQSSLDMNPFDATFLVAWLLAFDGLSQFDVQPPALVTDLSPALNTRQGSALLALKPVSWQAITNSGQIGPELWSNWFDYILSGTLSRIYRLPSKPYTNAQAAQIHNGHYRSGILKAKAVADGNYNGDAGGRWRYPTFARGRRKN